MEQTTIFPREKWKKIGNWEYVSYPGITREVFTILLDKYDSFLSAMKDEERPLFFFKCDYVIGEQCTKPERVWISLKGNILMNYMFPISILKTRRQIEFFPLLISVAIADTLNKYAPGEFTCKFINDVVCRKHKAKICGILSFIEPKTLHTGFGLNMVVAPPNELIRREGLTACCLKEHCKGELPSQELLLSQIGDRILELAKEIEDDVNKYIDIINPYFCFIEGKKLQLKMNNPDADAEKDGVFCCTEFPNALLKGILNDKEWDGTALGRGKNTFWDTIIFTVKDIPSPEDLAFREKLLKFMDDFNNK